MIDPTRLITHRFKLSAILEAYETFGNAASTKALINSSSAIKK